MQLRFQVNMQHIVRMDSFRVVAGSKNYISCAFQFSADWNGIIKTAVFAKGNVVYHAVLKNDAISADEMPVFSAGIWRVSVFGGDLITADAAALYVLETGFSEENVPEAPSTGVYESLTALIQENIDKTTELENKIVGGGTPISFEEETLIIGL